MTDKQFTWMVRISLTAAVLSAVFSVATIALALGR